MAFSRIITKYYGSYDVVDASTSQDSDVDSHSVCSASDTLSAHISLSGITDKTSLASSVGHGTLLEVTNTALITTSSSPGKLYILTF